MTDPVRLVWTDWSFEPGIALPLMLTAFVYARGIRTLKHRAPRARGRLRRSAILFSCGLGSVVLALMSPLDALSEALFSAHMVQHLILIVVAAPLCVSAAPLVAFLWGLPQSFRHRLLRAWQASRTVQRSWLLLTTPALAFTLHTAAIWFWHFPRPYEMALHSESIHALEHLSFFGTALIFWWLVIQPTGHRRLPYGAALLFVGGALLQGGALGALLLFSSKPWYPAHAAGAHAWGFTALQDQQLAGLIMWVPAGFAYVATACVLFLAWMRELESSTRRFESALLTHAPYVL